MTRDLPTRAISLIQPWAWLVIHGPKDIENRTWWTPYRGPIWIAASAQVTRGYWSHALETIERIGGTKLVRSIPSRETIDRGCIIGRAKIVDCILPGGYDPKTAENPRKASQELYTYNAVRGKDGKLADLHPQYLCANPWHFRDQYGYVLEDRTAVTPVPCKGFHQLWTVKPTVLAQLVKVAA